MSGQYANQQPQGYNNHVRKVAIVGAGGQVGTYIVEALLKTGKHQLTAITRADSTSKVPDGVETAKVNYDDHSSLVNALQGQDALIITMAVTAPPDTSAKLIKAASDAKVPWVLPNEWGIDHLYGNAAQETMIGEALLKNRNLIKECGGSSFIAFINGFWYEYSLSQGPNWYGFNFKHRQVTLYDDGKTKINTTTFPQVGRGVASLLSLKILPDDENDKSLCLNTFRNDCVMISSFRISQEDMLESVLRVTNAKREDWMVTYQGSKERYEEGKKELQSGDRLGFGKLLYARAMYPDGTCDFETRHGLHNDKLGLPKEDLDEFTKIAVGWAAEKGQLGVD